MKALIFRETGEPKSVLKLEEMEPHGGRREPSRSVSQSDGFNEGWIDFESGEANSRKERTTLESVLRSLVTSNPNS